MDKPIAYASRSLNTAEQKYSQLDKEALAILFGVSKFHHYLYGRRFIKAHTAHIGIAREFGIKPLGQPWVRIHADYAVPFLGKMYLFWLMHT